MPGKGSKGKFCLDTAGRALDFFIDFYGVPYPLQKSDLLAIPDFAAGAMENWGCVTYREAKVLTDAGSSLATKKGIARTVCHELAHQWFGNLTTMEWWDGLFLNEGFARFMEFKAVDRLFPHWNIWTEFVQSVYSLAMSLDAMKTSHPVEMPCETPDEIDSMFDAISYAKGASVLRMLSDYLGDERFMKGIRIYLNRHAYGSARSGDLWKALAEGSSEGEGGRIDVAAFVKPWISQVGFPVVTVDDENGTVTMERFFASGREGEGADPTSGQTSGHKWPCPFSFPDGEKIMLDVDDEASVQALLAKIKAIKALKATCSKGTTSPYYNLNANRAGFYRVNYSSSNWSSLKAALAPSVLPTIDRVALIDDCFALGKAGYAPVAVPLDLVSSFGGFGVDDFVVWQEISEQLLGLAGLYKSEEWFPEFQLYLVRIAGGQAERLGWERKEGEPENSGSFRAAVHSIMAAGGDEATGARCCSLFAEYAGGGAAVPADLRKLVYKTALRRDEAAVAPKLLELYRATAFPEEQQNIMLSLGHAQDGERHKELLEWALFSGEVRTQDVAHALSNLGSSSDENADRAFEVLGEEFGRIEEKFGKGPMYGIVVTLLCRGGSGGREKCARIDEFFEAHSVGNGGKRILQAKEGLLLREKRLERDKPVMEKWIEEQR